MFRNFLLVFITACAAFKTHGQISIGPGKPDTNSVLTLASENKGLRLPRLSLGARDALGANRSLTSGMIVYNTTSQQFNFFNGTQWIGFEASNETGNFSSYRHSISVSYNNREATAFYTDNSGTGHFVRQTLEGDSFASLSSKHQVVLYSKKMAWVFNVNYEGTGVWTSYPTGGAVSSLANDDLIVLYRSGMAYGLSQDSVGNPVWLSQSTGSGTLAAVASKKQAVVYRGGSAFGFSRSAAGICAWRRTSVVGNVQFAKASYNQILLADADNAYVFTGDVTGSGVWYDAPVSGVTATIATQD